MRLNPPTPLGPRHHTGGFACGVAALDQWLTSLTAKNERSGASRTYVVTDENLAVVAYYAIATGSVGRGMVSAPLARNTPDPVPIILLGRLAVASSCQGIGIGKALVRDCFLRCRNAASIVGAKALLTQAIDARAATFYAGLGFSPSPFDPMILMLPLWRK